MLGTRMPNGQFATFADTLPPSIPPRPSPVSASLFRTGSSPARRPRPGRSDSPPSPSCGGRRAWTRGRSRRRWTTRTGDGGVFAARGSHTDSDATFLSMRTASDPKLSHQQWTRAISSSPPWGRPGLWISGATRRPTTAQRQDEPVGLLPGRPAGAQHDPHQPAEGADPATGRPDDCRRVGLLRGVGVRGLGPSRISTPPTSRAGAAGRDSSISAPVCASRTRSRRRGPRRSCGRCTRELTSRSPPTARRRSCIRTVSASPRRSSAVGSPIRSDGCAALGDHAEPPQRRTRASANSSSGPTSSVRRRFAVDFTPYLPGETRSEYRRRRPAIVPCRRGRRRRPRSNCRASRSTDAAWTPSVRTRRATGFR